MQMHIMDSDKIKTKTPTNSIVVWRIVFSYEIVIYHFLNAYNKSTSLHLATEFFFVVSGYILAMEMNKQKFDSSWSLLISRLKRYAPHYYLSLLIEFLVLFLHDKTRYKMFDLISGLFFLQGVGLNVNQWINVPTWYLSVLLLGDFFLYYLLQHHKTILENFLLPAIIIVVYVKQYNTNGYLSHGLGATGIYWNSALFLGIATMGAGVLLYKASNYAIKYISNRRIVSRIVEGGGIFRSDYGRTDMA